ncbi:MAG: DUF502 domain-containing protein [Alphaproteobacteria bacterium]|nr:DUF502 domain-containing protein [Alphaproteobacteria bacterium]
MKTIKKESKTTLKTYFFTGILVTAPVAITLYVAWHLITYIDTKVTGLIPAQYNPNELLPYGLPGLGILLLLVFFTGVGMLTANFIGQALIKAGYRLINRMPVISGLYNAIKKILETLIGNDKNKAFRQPVLVEYPRRDLWTIAFITGEPYPEVKRKLNDKTLLSIYVPTTPNPTSGFFLYVPKKDVIFLNISVEEALKLILSTGIINPNNPKIKKIAHKKRYRKKEIKQNLTVEN